MLLVVVGNIDRAHIERLVRQTIGQLPRGNYKWAVPPRIPELQTALVIERRQLPTNYILGYYSGPLANGRDYQALRVATSVLTGRMFAEIRSRQSLTYDVRAVLDRAATAGGLFVSTCLTHTTLKLMRPRSSTFRRERSISGTEAARGAIHHGVLPDTKPTPRRRLPRAGTALRRRLQGSRAFRRRAEECHAGRHPACGQEIHEGFPFRLRR